MQFQPKQNQPQLNQISNQGAQSANQDKNVKQKLSSKEVKIIQSIQKNLCDVSHNNLFWSSFLSDALRAKVSLPES